MNADLLQDLQSRFSQAGMTPQQTADGMTTLWVNPADVVAVLSYLKNDVDRPFRMLYDLTAIDERLRANRQGQPAADFSVVYDLLSFERNEDVRIKTPLKGEPPSLPSISGLWANANWYEREMWDMFGVRPEGHPNLRRILMPTWWEGHPLRKDHPARATDMEPYYLNNLKTDYEQDALRFVPEEWGLERQGEDEEFLFLNVGPQHPGTHGPFRIILQLDGETIVNAIPDIGFHHRGAEKMGERQSWHTYIPYTDRVDYVSGVVNNLAYLSSVEKLAGIDIPPRAQVIRVMLTEFFRIISHLVYYGTFAGDLGQISPVFYMFTDREYAFKIIESVTGFRMHPGWFRIGGVGADLPDGWDKLVRDFLDYMPARLDEYDKSVLGDTIFRARTEGVAEYTLDEAIEWGATGPALRACGLAWDWRKKRPYSGYENFDFEIPTYKRGDAYGRLHVHAQEMRQSLRIIEQCLKNMPEGPYKSHHPLATPPLKQHTMLDIETLINHFLGVSYGPVIPPGECSVHTEGSKGSYTYYVVSDGNVLSYRTRIRTASFPHLQMIPMLMKGYLVSDLLTLLGSIDFVLADVDR